jgi:hypothetical protein
MMSLESPSNENKSNDRDLVYPAFSRLPLAHPILRLAILHRKVVRMEMHPLSIPMRQ